jgi:hypothetical protein
VLIGSDEKIKIDTKKNVRNIDLDLEEQYLSKHLENKYSIQFLLQLMSI